METGVIWQQNAADPIAIDPALKERGSARLYNCKKTAAKTLNRSYQFSVTLNGLKQGSSVTGKVYMIVINKETEEYELRFSAEETIINDGHMEVSALCTKAMDISNSTIPDSAEDIEAYVEYPEDFQSPVIQE